MGLQKAAYHLFYEKHNFAKLAIRTLIVGWLFFACHVYGNTSSGSEKVDDHGESYHIMEVGSFKRGGNIKDDILGRCGVPLTGKQERSDAKRSGHGNVKRSNGGGLGLKMDLSHACPHPNLNSSWTDAVLQSLARDRLRLNFIQSKMDKYNKKAYNKQGVNLPVQSGNQIGYDDYFVTAGFGTPTKDFILTIDTGSDVTWMQCQPCASTEPCYTQQNPIFDPKQSSSYKPLDCQSPKCSSCSESNTCSYDISYGDGSTSSGDVGQDTLKLGSDTFEDFAFGCGHDNQGLFNGTAGIIGLGRTSISLVSQTTSKYGGQFSYCLPDFGSLNPGSLSMGDGSIPSSAVFTPLLADSLFDSLYSVGLNAISVGDKPVSVPSSGSVGRKLLEDKQVETIIDSGTVISRLDQPLYDAFKDAFIQMTPQLPRADPFEIFDTCFNLTGQSQVTVPTVTFHFEGNANVKVDGLGILMPVTDDGLQACLAFAPSTAVQGGALNIIGNFQQQRLRVAYDTQGQRIGFFPELCTH